MVGQANGPDVITTQGHVGVQQKSEGHLKRHLVSHLKELLCGGSDKKGKMRELLR